MKKITRLKKLLSHRVRGYSAIEHSPSAFRKACKSPVQYIEIDTRVSKDGEIYVYHDTVFNNRNKKQRIYLSKIDSSIINESLYSDGQKILLLQEALDIFRNRIYDNQILCIDIKDFGFEKKHLEMVRNAGLENNVCFVSWMPQSLVALKELGAQTPLILSHWNLIRFGIVSKLLCWFFRNGWLRIFHFIIIGHNKFSTPLANFAHGFQHGYFSNELPDNLADILAQSNGGICVNLMVVSKKLINYCKKKNLKLWVFSVKDKKSFDRYNILDGIDVIFCDNAAKLVGVNINT